MRCPRCGAENPAVLATCEVCGSPLRRVTVVDDDAAPARASLWQSPAPPPTAPDLPPVRPDPPPPAARPVPPISPAVGQAWQGVVAPVNPPVSPVIRGEPPPVRGPAPSPQRTVLGNLDQESAVAGQLRGVLLEYASRTDAGKVHTLRAGRTAIGRSADCDLVLEDQQASKQHAIVYIRGDDASFMDISSNGSVVDGRRLHGGQATLQQGSTIIIGTRLYIFLYASERTLSGMK